jgi:hypothetical protein
MVSNIDGGSIKSSKSKTSMVKSIKSAFSKSSKSKSKSVKAEEHVEDRADNVDTTRDMPATTAKIENPLDASQIVQLQEIVNNAVATTLSKVMGDEEDAASKKSSKSIKSNKSALSRLSKKSKAPSEASGKPALSPTIVEEEAVDVEKSPTATPAEDDKLAEETPAQEEQTHTEPAEAEALLSSSVALPSPDAAESVLGEEKYKSGFFCFAC